MHRANFEYLATSRGSMQMWTLAEWMQISQNFFPACKWDDDSLAIKKSTRIGCHWPAYANELSLDIPHRLAPPYANEVYCATALRNRKKPNTTTEFMQMRCWKTHRAGPCGETRLVLCNLAGGEPRGGWRGEIWQSLRDVISSSGFE